MKVHGSALEYTVRPNRERFLPYALEGVRAAASACWSGRATRPRASGRSWRTSPRCPSAPGSGRRAWTCTRSGPAPPTSTGSPPVWSRATRPPGAASAGAAEALRLLDPDRDRIVSYVGKLIVSKGVDLLVAAWPLVVARVPDARLVVVGFGTYRDALDRFVEALRRRDLDELHEIAARGRELEGGPPGELSTCGRSSIAPTASGSPRRRRRPTGSTSPAGSSTTTFPRCSRPSRPRSCRAPSPSRSGWWPRRRPACGVLPLSAGHSGMAEVTATLAPALPGAAASAALVRGGPAGSRADRVEAGRLADARPGEAGARPDGAGGRGGPPLLVGERGRGRDRRGRASPPPRIVFRAP